MTLSAQNILRNYDEERRQRNVARRRSMTKRLDSMRERYGTEGGKLASGLFQLEMVVTPWICDERGTRTRYVFAKGTQLG